MVLVLCVFFSSYYIGIEVARQSQECPGLYPPEHQPVITPEYYTKSERVTTYIVVHLPQDIPARFAAM
ncbi:hypothetical protein KC19_7G129200 [Ceratodon purpureus]|uniref:Uncharacterized protein n=1 Tax=Ceratodon purpureus TaxID=3225 RepID=A0A8T0HB07_CERPU|nr:hypothetical protein KC19_7G129200 [Ceratodon purpureus]